MIPATNNIAGQTNGEQPGESGILAEILAGLTLMGASKKKKSGCMIL